MENKTWNKFLAWSQIGIGLVILSLPVFRFIVNYPHRYQLNITLTIIFGVVFPIGAIRRLVQMKRDEQQPNQDQPG